MILVLKAWGEACVVAMHEPVWGFLVPEKFGPHQSGNTSGSAYRQRAGGHQRSSFQRQGECHGGYWQHKDAGHTLGILIRV